METGERPNAQALLAELGFRPRLTIYLASAPGAGKTYRLLTDAQFQRRAGRRVAIGWVETKDRPGLEELARDFPRIPLKSYTVNGTTFTDFDVDAAIASDYETIVLDELAHSNPDGARNAKRWQDALALRAAGKSVLGAFNIQHLELVAPAAERIIGHPIREIVPVSLLKSADGVIALDVSPEVLETRLRGGRIVHTDDVDRAAMGVFLPSNLQMMRELLLQTVDALTVPVVSPAKTSTALAMVCGSGDPRMYLRRVGALAEALDLAVEVTVVDDEPHTGLAESARAAAEAIVIPTPDRLGDGRLDNVRAAFVAIPNGELAKKILVRPVDRDFYVIDPARPSAPSVADSARHPYGETVGDRQRIGYGKLVIYLGSVAGSGKTFAMLDRAHDLINDGVDVVAGLVETHGRVDTEAKLVGIHVLPRLGNGELDRESILQRHPKVVLIDELAHTNAPGSAFQKRFDDVIAILRQGISVITTLNIQHLDGLHDAVERLTGTHVRETLPDTILELADDVIFIDVTPEVLRERLREGKIYPLDRVEAALANFFRVENLSALRELTVRELMRARRSRRHAPPFGRIVLGVRARDRDAALIERMARLALRLSVPLAVIHIEMPGIVSEPAILEVLKAAAKAVARAVSRDKSAGRRRSARGSRKGAGHDRCRVAARQASILYAGIVCRARPQSRCPRNDGARAPLNARAMKQLVRLLFVLAVAFGAAAGPAGAQTATLIPSACASLCTSSIASSQLQNLSQLKSAIADYYTSGSYATEVSAIEADAQKFLDERIAAGVKKPALVLDIDDTSLLTFGYERQHDFGFDDASWNAAAAKGFPAIEATLALVKHAKAENVTIIFVTGRRAPQTELTRANLLAAGYPVDALSMRPVDDRAASVVPYKSGERAKYEAQGFDVVETIGDQWSDLAGGHAERAYKLPNPMYFLP